jgi:ABC-type multidrug transport system permease subunit
MNSMPRFWIAMQIVIIVCVLISAVIVLIKL